MIDLPRRSLRLPSAPAGWSLVALNITLGGSLITLFRDLDGRGHICAHQKSTWDVLTVIDPCPDFPLLDQGLDGTVVVASARQEPGCPNGMVIRPDESTAQIYCGDAIEHLQLDAEGMAWIGYFDEGVFGDNELSQRGLVRLGLDGSLRSSPREVIDDCYALNVSEDRVLASWYSSFPVIEYTLDMAEQRRLSRAPHPVKRAAFSDERLLFQEAYKDAQFHLGQWASSGWKHERSLTADDLFGRALGRDDRLLARGSCFHLVSEDLWTSVDIAKI